MVGFFWGGAVAAWGMVFIVLPLINCFHYYPGT